MKRPEEWPSVDMDCLKDDLGYVMSFLIGLLLGIIILLAIANP